jgi:hypothetical protein
MGRRCLNVYEIPRSVLVNGNPIAKWGFKKKQNDLMDRRPSLPFPFSFLNLSSIFFASTFATCILLQRPRQQLAPNSLDRFEHPDYSVDDGINQGLESIFHPT